MIRKWNPECLAVVSAGTHDPNSDILQLEMFNARDGKPRNGGGIGAAVGTKPAGLRHKFCAGERFTPDSAGWKCDA